MSTKETPGERLRARRREIGMAADELGKRAARHLQRDKPISPSAIRNQENGTNGIPWVSAIAYADVLGVTPQWLLTGVEYVVRTEPDDPDPRDAALAELEIEVISDVSAAWEEPTVIPEPEARTVCVEVWGYWDVALQGYRVRDDSFMPVYPRGTILITAPTWHTGVREGDHLIVSSVPDGRVVQTLREVQRVHGLRGGAADLVGIGANPAPTLDWFETRARISRRIYPEACVIAVYRQIPDAQRGRPIRLPDHLEDTLEKRIEAAAALDAEQAARLAGGSEPRLGDDAVSDWIEVEDPTATGKNET